MIEDSLIRAVEAINLEDSLHSIVVDDLYLIVRSPFEFVDHLPQTIICGRVRHNPFRNIV